MANAFRACLLHLLILQACCYKIEASSSAHHFKYNPPRVISYGGHNGYPVYCDKLPAFVYEYRSSESRYCNLLAGLALYNLGRISGHSAFRQHYNNYTLQHFEACKFRVVYANGTAEEMGIDCRMITHFIYEYDSHEPCLTAATTVNNTAYTTSTFPVQVDPGNDEAKGQNNKTNTQWINALDPRFRGDPVEITPDMKCYVINSIPRRSWQKPVPCGLLQEYSVQSLSFSTRTLPSWAMFLFTIFVFVL